MVDGKKRVTGLRRNRVTAYACCHYQFPLDSLEPPIMTVISEIVGPKGDGEHRMWKELICYPTNL